MPHAPAPRAGGGVRPRPCSAYQHTPRDSTVCGVAWRGCAVGHGAAACLRGGGATCAVLTNAKNSSASTCRRRISAPTLSPMQCGGT
jgi:hypothetical protein